VQEAEMTMYANEPVSCIYMDLEQQSWQPVPLHVSTQHYGPSVHCIRKHSCASVIVNRSANKLSVCTYLSPCRFLRLVYCGMDLAQQDHIDRYLGEDSGERHH
jgi:hypothetical protein